MVGKVGPTSASPSKSHLRERVDSLRQHQGGDDMAGPHQTNGLLASDVIGGSAYPRKVLSAPAKPTGPWMGAKPGRSPP